VFSSSRAIARLLRSSAPNLRPGGAYMNTIILYPGDQ